MILSEETVNLMLEATYIANILGIDGLILDEKGIRGYNDDEGIIVAAIDDFEFEFENLGLSRLDALKRKANLITNLDITTVEAVPSKKDESIIEKLKFDGGKINFEFRCASPKAIKDIPSTRLNKTPLFYFDITQKDVESITQSSSAMRSKNMTIQGKEEKVQFRFSDDTGDILNYKIDSDLNVETDLESVSLTINLKKMLPIFKLAAQNNDFRLNILKNNIIHITIDNMDILVMPEV